MTDPSPDQVLDTKGMNCPLPVLKAKKALKALPDGAVLQILATDPGATGDFEAFCRTTGNELLDSSQDAEVYSFLIRKAG